MSIAEGFRALWDELVRIFWDPVDVVKATVLTAGMLMLLFLGVDPRACRLIRQAITAVFHRHR
jgi:hypothetical protein